MALNRKFDLDSIERQDVVPLTDWAKNITGLKDFNELMKEALKSL